MWKMYAVYGVAVLALVYWTSSRGYIIVNWSEIFSDDGGGGGYYHGGGYHK